MVFLITMSEAISVETGRSDVCSYSVKGFPWPNTSPSQEQATVSQEVFPPFNSEKVKIIFY